MGEPDRVFRLRIDLLETDLAVWRNVDVPSTITLRALHDVIQAVMPFEDRHLYEFRVGEHRYGVPDLEFGADLTVRDAKSIRLARFIGEGLTNFGYIYDFGDHWEHAVKVEDARNAEPSVPYPILVDASGRAPPEDVGGAPGLDEFLAAITRSHNPEHRRMLDWYGGPFDPTVTELDEVTKRLGKLAKRRAMGKAAAARGRTGSRADPDPKRTLVPK